MLLATRTMHSCRRQPVTVLDAFRRIMTGTAVNAAGAPQVGTKTTNGTAANAATAPTLGTKTMTGTAANAVSAQKPATKTTTGAAVNAAGALQRTTSGRTALAGTAEKFRIITTPICFRANVSCVANPPTSPTGITNGSTASALNAGLKAIMIGAWASVPVVGPIKSSFVAVATQDTELSTSTVKQRVPFRVSSAAQPF